MDELFGGREDGIGVDSARSSRDRRRSDRLKREQPGLIGPTDPSTATLRAISLGAGVQSTCMVLMALEGDIDRPDCAIFADTGWEPKAVYNHLDWLRKHAEKEGFEIHVVSAGNIREDVIRAVGSDKVGRVGQPPFFVKDNPEYGSSEGMLWRKCTKEYKIDAIHKKIRSLLGVETRKRVKKGTLVEQWMGITTDEAQRMKTSRVSWIKSVYPLIDAGMSRYSCLDWMGSRGYPQPPKSACIGCPYRSDSSWRLMKSERPEEFDDAAEFDRSIRRGIPGVKGSAFLHRSCVPLDEVDFRTDVDKGQGVLFDDAFGQECEGMCGV